MSNKLLASTNIILFLNKTDIMKSKLVRLQSFFIRLSRLDLRLQESGIKLVDYVNSYGTRPNDFENASSCAFCPFYPCGEAAR